MSYTYWGKTLVEVEYNYAKEMESQGYFPEDILSNIMDQRRMKAKEDPNFRDRLKKQLDKEKNASPKDAVDNTSKEEPKKEAPKEDPKSSKSNTAELPIDDDKEYTMDDVRDIQRKTRKAYRNGDGEAFAYVEVLCKIMVQVNAQVGKLVEDNRKLSQLVQNLTKNTNTKRINERLDSLEKAKKNGNKNNEIDSLRKTVKDLTEEVNSLKKQEPTTNTTVGMTEDEVDNKLDTLYEDIVDMVREMISTPSDTTEENVEVVEDAKENNDDFYDFPVGEELYALLKDKVEEVINLADNDLERSTMKDAIDTLWSEVGSNNVLDALEEVYDCIGESFNRTDEIYRRLLSALNYALENKDKNPELSPSQNVHDILISRNIDMRYRSGRYDVSEDIANNTYYIPCGDCIKYKQGVCELAYGQNYKRPFSQIDFCSEYIIPEEEPAEEITELEKHEHLSTTCQKQIDDLKNRRSSKSGKELADINKLIENLAKEKMEHDAVIKEIKEGDNNAVDTWANGNN